MIAEDNEMTIKVTCRPTPAAKKNLHANFCERGKWNVGKRDDRGGEGCKIPRWK